jgi:sugar phosphate isomerase/epimerase
MNNQPSRRNVLAAGAAVAAFNIVPSSVLAQSTKKKPNSNFGGVQIGIITYSYRSMSDKAEDLLGYITQNGISSIELMGNSAEQFAGAPAAKKGKKKDKTADNNELLQWRLSASMDKFKALRKMYNDAGINIHIVKFPDIGNDNMPDEQIDYYFQVAKALGARGITRELSDSAAKRLGPIADKHGIMIAFHNHTQIKPATYDGDILTHGKNLGINFDIGHYLAGTNESPLEFIKKHCDRIVSLHIKDRKLDNGPNMPFGQGDTPVAEILQYMKENKLTFPCDIELEYKIPEGSDAAKEVAKCVQFCKQALK